MTYIYYQPSQDQIFLSEYHYGVSINLLPSAFDGEDMKNRKCGAGEDKFYYIGRL